MPCSLCQQSGHNCRTCPQAPADGGEILRCIQTLRTNNPSDSFKFKRIHCEYKSEMYKSHKKYIMKRDGSLGMHGERLLFHGTDKCNIKSILTNDLLLNSMGKHGTVWGKGVYFTRHLKLAMKYSPGHTKHILVYRVHVGDVVVGNRNMIQLPVDPLTRKQYDTAVNSLVGHVNGTGVYSILVKFKNQAYDLIGVLEIKLGKETNMGKYNKVEWNERSQWDGNWNGQIHSWDQE